MQQYSFKDDYSERAHPRLLEALAATNLEAAEGYGNDRFCVEARELIVKEIGVPTAQVHFLPSGSTSNVITLASMLRPYESVIAPESGHIHVHETGALEATGHKINAVPTVDGKLRPVDIDAMVAMHIDEHMVMPRAVCVAQSTELGGVYSLAELEALRAACDKHNLYLYIDGARLGAALVSEACDVTIQDIARLADAFYIGGTKNGALCGEAVVLVNSDLHEHFRYRMKNMGALLAKGHVLGIQFTELFRDGLYWQLATHAYEAAKKLAAGLKEAGYEFASESTTNQLFPIVTQEQFDALAQQFGFHKWTDHEDGRIVIRFVTSWATTDEAVEALIAAVAQAA